LDGHGNTTIQKVMEPVAYQEQLDGLVCLFGAVAIGPKWDDDNAVQTVRLVEETWVLRSRLWTATENAIQAHSRLASQRQEVQMVSANLEQATTCWRGLCNEVKELKSTKCIVEAREKAKLSQLAFGELFACKGTRRSLRLLWRTLRAAEFPIRRSGKHRHPPSSTQRRRN
jgi:hypothetical protein